MRLGTVFLVFGMLMFVAEPCLAQQKTSANSMVNSIGMKLTHIPAGEFAMGSDLQTPGARPDEQPRHRVRITQPFWMGVYEVTQGEFRQVMGRNPAFFSNEWLKTSKPQRWSDLNADRFPVEGVSWLDAVEFCRRLSTLPAEKKATRAYRLPTETEWEYACRSGSKTVFSFGDSLSSHQANFNGAYPFGEAKKGPFLNRTTTVGSYPSNAFGLFDMHGSVNEWCWDRFDRDYYRRSPTNDPLGAKTGTPRVIRGGDWYSDGRDCRSAFRYADIPDGVFYAIGFRVVCEIGSPRSSVMKAIAEFVPDSDARNRTPPQGDAGLKVDLSAGEDWPRWRGRRGDGVWRGPKLADQWPKKGLARVWRQPIGGGYGGVAVAGRRVFVMDKRPQTRRSVSPRQTSPNRFGPASESESDSAMWERILCFDAVSGKRLWEHAYPVDYAGVSYDNGPRSTPTVHRGRVYTLGAVGHLHCLSETDGKVIWSHDLVRKFGARAPNWGLSASPIVFRHLLIVHAGAEPNGCYLAFDLESGALRWKNLPDPAGYATPILIDRQGAKQLVAWTPTHIHGLDPQTGRRLWSEPFKVNYGTSIAYPIFHENLVLVSSYYDGAKAIQLSQRSNDRAGPQVVWQDRRNLRALMAQPLYRQGYAYLLDKRHGLTCFHLKTGEKRWDDDNRLTPKGRNPQATMVWLSGVAAGGPGGVAAGGPGGQDRVLALNSEGDLVLARFRPEGYLELARANIIGPTWAHPAYAGNGVFARNDEELICVVLPE